MAIVCEKLGAVFYIPPLPLSDKFRRLLHLINASQSDPIGIKGPRHIRRIPGYAPRPFDEVDKTTHEGLQRIAVLRDPNQNCYLTYKYFCAPKAFKRRGEEDALAELGLSMAPSFEEFVENIDRYKTASKFLEANLASLQDYLGPDLSYFSRHVSIDRKSQLLDVLGDIAQAVPEDADFAGDPEGPPIQLNSVTEQLTTLNADQYRYLKGHFDDKAAFTERAEMERAAQPPLARLVVHDNAPDRNVAVACMLKEDEVTVRKFIDHYTNLGVGQIFLYFDDPDDPGFDVASEYSNVTAARCDADFWAGNRKNAVEGRQSQCYTRTYQQLDAGWLIVCDADEFVTADVPLSQLLESCEDDQRVVRFRPGEAVWNQNDDSSVPFSAPYIRRPIPQDVWRSIARFKKPETRSMFRHGLLSHRSGKYAIRIGSQASFIGLHRAVFDDGYNSVRLPLELPSGILVHFDAISFSHWLAKVKNRLRKGHGFFGFDAARKEQLKKMRDLDDTEYLGLFKDLYHISEREKELLTAVGALAEIDIFR